VVVSGGAWLDQSVLQLLADRYPHHEEMRLDALAEREQAVLRGILSGLSNRKIADRIGASEASVKGTLQQFIQCHQSCYSIVVLGIDGSVMAEKQIYNINAT
jgi:DNA-binding NarL/FixJ family response regulator